MNKLSFDKTVFLWFFVASVTLLTLSVMFVSANHKIEEQNAWVDHTYIVENQLEQTYSSLRGAMVEQRGYIITGAADYKERYLTLATDVRQHLADLKNLVSDNPVQSTRMADFDKVINQRFTTMDRVNELFETDGLESVVKFIKTGIGLQQMENVRRFVEILKQEEQSLLGQRKEHLDQTVNLIGNLCMAGFAFCSSSWLGCSALSGARQ